MANLWAFIDESKNSTYVLVAVVVDSREIPSLRKAVVAQRLSGQRRIHFRQESPIRKKRLAAKFSTLPFVLVSAVSKNPLEISARQECILDLLGQLHRLGVARVIFERDCSIEVNDRKFIERTLTALGARSIEYRHEDPYYEPALWVADAAAWVVAKHLESDYGFEKRRG